MISITPPVSELKRALALAEQIQTLEAELKVVLSGTGSAKREAIGNAQTPTSVTKPGRKKKSGMSAEERARIAAAQRARWAKSKGDSVPATVSARGAESSKPAKKAKRKVSPEARARMVAAAKKRWAKVK